MFFARIVLQNIMQQPAELNEEVVRKSIGGVDNFLRIEDDESTAAQDVVRHAGIEVGIQCRHTLYATIAWMPVGNAQIYRSTLRVRCWSTLQSLLDRFDPLTAGVVLFVLLQLSAKIPRLQARITLVVFNYIRRGLVEKDKLIVASVMALRILRHEDKNGGQKTAEAFVSPRPAGDSAVYPEEARR